MPTFDQLIHSDRPVLVDFYAEWCGPCKMMNPVLSEVAAKIGDQAKILKVDVDKNRQAAQKFGVQSVPTLLVFKRGEIKWRQSGVVNTGRLVDILRLFS